MPAAWVTHTASHNQRPRTARTLAHDRARVRREREHPVDRARRIGRTHAARQRREHALGLGLAQVEVVGRERHQRRLHRALAGRTQRRLRRHDRLVAVVPDAVVIVALTEVQRHVLMANHRLPRPRCRRSARRARAPGRSTPAGAGRRRAGSAPPPSRRRVGPQMPAHSSTRSHSMRPWSVSTPCTRPVADVEAGDGDAALERDARGLGLPRERRRRSARPCRPRRSAPSRRPGSWRGPAAVSARRLPSARAAPCPRCRRTARTPGAASAPPCARAWWPPRCRRRRTSTVRRRPRGCRRGRRNPARCGTSSASRWSGR